MADPTQTGIPVDQVKAIVAEAVSKALAGQAAAESAKPKGPKPGDKPKPAPSAHEVKAIAGKLRDHGEALSQAERDTLLRALADKAGL